MLRYLNPLAWLLAYLFLIWPAFFNGFPLLYSDSGTYIIAAFTGDIPIDRPILYSYFLRFSSLGISLFIALSVQIFIVLHIIYLFLKTIIKTEFTSLGMLFSVMILSVFSGLANISSQLMPDIFSALLFLLIPIFFEIEGRYSKLLILFYILLSIGVHTTNLLLFALLFPLAFLLFIEHKNIQKYSLAITVYVIGIFLIPTINYSLKGEFFLSKSSGLFLGASLMEMGVAQEYLERNSETSPGFLKNREHPQEGGSMAFLWSEESPLIDSACLARGGWGRCWEEKNDSMKSFVRNVLTDRQSLQYLIPKVFEAFGKQFVMIEIGMLSKQAEHSAVYQPLIENYPNDQGFYTKADQYTDDLYFESLSRNQLVLILLSLILSPLLYVYGKKQKLTMLKFFLFCFSFLAINAFLCGVLSNPVSRYQARVIWLFPFLTFAWLWCLVIEQRLHAKFSKL